MMIDEVKLDDVLLDLGHDDFNRGTAMLRDAVKMYRPGMMMTKDVYPTVAWLVGSSPARVERNIRHAIEKAWDRAPEAARLRYFGNSVDPEAGRPTVGEYTARLAYICRRAEGQE